MTRARKDHMESTADNTVGVRIAFDRIRVVRDPAALRPALDNVTLAIAPGEAVGLIGPSGAGKSSLVRVLLGLDAPAAGTLHLDGVPASRAREVVVPPGSRGFGYVPQALGIWDHARVDAHIRLALSDSLRRGARGDRVRAILSEVGLGALARRRGYQLSGGERTRLALARALAGASRGLVLDEPFAGLDYSLRDQILAAIRSRRAAAPASRPTMLLVSHVRDEVLALVDRFVVIEDGRVVQTGTADQLRAAPATAFVARYLTDPSTPAG